MVKLNQAYGARGLHILAFPCNQFLKQESGSAEEILEGARGRGLGLRGTFFPFFCFRSVGLRGLCVGAARMGDPMIR